MIEEVLPDIFRIRVPLVGPLKELNAYLVRGVETRHLLIDSGFNMPQAREALAGGVRELGISFADMDFFISHLHADHCGLVPSLRENPESAVFASAYDAAAVNRLVGDMNEYWKEFLPATLSLGMPEEEAGALPANHPTILFGPEHALPFTVLKEGDMLRYGAYALRVVETPGHTPGLLCLYDAQNKALFSSDHLLGDITPNITNWAGFDSLGDYLVSLEKVDCLDIELALPGHRSLIRNPRRRIAELKQHHAARLAEVKRILDESCGLTAYQVASKMTWSLRCSGWEEFPVQQKWFATREASSHLLHLEVCGDVASSMQNGALVFRR